MWRMDTTLCPLCAFFPKEMECPIHSASFLIFTEKRHDGHTLCLYVHINAWTVCQKKNDFYQWETDGEEAFKVMVLNELFFRTRMGTACLNPKAGLEVCVCTHIAQKFHFLLNVLQSTHCMCWGLWEGEQKTRWLVLKTLILLCKPQPISRVCKKRQIKEQRPNASSHCSLHRVYFLNLIICSKFWGFSIWMLHGRVLFGLSLVWKRQRFQSFLIPKFSCGRLAAKMWNMRNRSYPFH